MPKYIQTTPNADSMMPTAVHRDAASSFWMRRVSRPVTGADPGTVSSMEAVT